MRPELFAKGNVIVQGITGTHGAFHTHNMVAYGTTIVAGTSPQKAGEMTPDGIPVYATIRDILVDHVVDVSVIFVPAPYAKAAILEAIDANIPLIVCITEHIPVHDMLYIKQRLVSSQSRLVGPNCPGVLMPDQQLLGIIPAALASQGTTAIVSRSGTLTYEAMDMLTRHGFGQKYIIGIGGDMIQGTSFVDCLELFQADPEVERIVLIGEIGGTYEIEAGDYIRSSVTKPVYAYVAGHAAPTGVQMGHAGAILGTNLLESAQAKTQYLGDCGATTAPSITELIEQMR